MKKLMPYYKKLLCSFALVLASICTYANHLVGMDLFYTWVTGNTYKITLIAYADCGSAATTSAFAALSSNAPEIYIYNGATYVTTIRLAIQPPTTGVEITPVCPADMANTQCTNVTYTIPGIKKFVYSLNYTVSGPSAVWRFLFTGQLAGVGSLAGRALSITNISSSPVTYTQLVDTLNNTTYHNSSPTLSNVPTPFFCLDNDDNYNPGAIDPDGDSLRFFLVRGEAGSTTSTPGGFVTYLGSYTPTAPLGVTTMSFDQRTGHLAFHPDILQRSLVVYNIREFRAGTFVGTSQREMTFLVQTCTNTPPTGRLDRSTGSGVIDDATHFHICRNSGPFSIFMDPTQADTTNNITVTVAGLPAGCTFTTTGNGTPHPHCTISWTSTGVTPGIYTFYVTFTDDNCPLAGTQTIAYTISILTEPAVTFSILSSATCTKRAAVNIIPSGGGSPWIIKVSRPGDTIQTFTGVTGTFLDSIPVGSFTITAFSSAAFSCRASVPITIAGPTPISLTPTFTNPTYCGASDGTIRLYHNLVPGAVDTVKYTFNGIWQTPITRTVAPDSTILLTGLLAGTYASITTTYYYCTSNPAGPIVLTNPPFTMRALSFVNPVWCGVCNGSITIYGLRPGQTDTVNYTRDGIAQPAVSRFVGPDSTITITGLCPGTYDNFIARTAGVCVSNRLGPVTLSAPPFTIRTLTSTNPAYCGICNGTVKIWGVHPGGPDTVSYTRDGIAQPPFASLVGSDSTITITGLCQGTYDNVIVRAGPTCVSNRLGPAVLTVPPFTMRAISFTNPSYCGICNGVIRLYGLYPGQTDTITYTKDGVPQPAVIRTIGADSQVVITGLCAGVYANFVARTGGICVSNTLGPVTLTVPPFTIRALSFRNPDYCGVCNGRITIHGAYPGQRDTVSYTKDGVAQTPFIAVVAPDSTITITGLCHGVYDNFIARTGGVCVSNRLGPVTLTVPPFTIRALSHTNPVYCGICNGTITIYGAYPGQTDTISYTKDGVPQTPVVVTIPPDSSVTLINLCHGVYDNFVARTGGVCVSNSLGPITLTVPPFTIRADTFRGPTKCGFCDGFIRIFGVYPGQTDTFYYDRDGVPQPPVSFIIPPDSQVVITGLCKGVYTNIIAKTAGVCVSNALGPDTLKEPPIIPDFDYVIREDCDGDTLITTNKSWPASDLSYTWSFGDGGISAATHPIHVYYSPGTFDIKLIITNTRCYDSITKSITLNNLINAGFNAVPDSFICQGESVALTNTSLGVDMRYVWLFGDGATATTLNASHIYPNTGKYNVKLAVTNYVPCFDTATRLLEVDSISVISMKATDSVICKATGITFTGIYTDIGLRSVIWHFGDGDSIRNVNPISHMFDGAGIYTVTVAADYRACPDTSASRRFVVYGSPGLYIGTDTSICKGSVAIRLGDYKNINDPDARWRWSTGQTTAEINVVEPGVYYATVYINGCQSTDTVEVFNDCYINLPNAFTPNGDGMNDYFFPRELLTRGLTTFRMDIYNRWGELIFTTESLDGRGWDGSYNGQMQPQGVFIYVLHATFKDGQRFDHKGNVTLLK
ncbi:MAG: domain containing protein [Flavipsychrobacter sp.]|nr:domain containing protein [Flavipsychrobacter sp.]